MHTFTFYSFNLNNRSLIFFLVLTANICGGVYGGENEKLAIVHEHSLNFIYKFLRKS